MCLCTLPTEIRTSPVNPAGTATQSLAPGPDTVARPPAGRRLELTWEITLVGALGLEVAALVGVELGVCREALGAHFALEQALLLVALHVRLEVVHCGELLAAAAHRAAKGSQLVVRLQVSFELVGGGEGPAAAIQRALEGPPALEAAVRQQVHFQLVLLGEAQRALRLRTAVDGRAGAGGHRPAAGHRSARGLRARGGCGMQARGGGRGRGGQREDATVEAHQEVLVVDGDRARQSRAGGGGWDLLRGARARAGFGLLLPVGVGRAGHFQQDHEGVAAVLRGWRARPRGLLLTRPGPAIFRAPQQQQAAAPGARTEGRSRAAAESAWATAMLISARDRGGQHGRDVHLRPS